MYTVNVWIFLIKIYKRPAGKNYSLALSLRRFWFLDEKNFFCSKRVLKIP